MNLSTPDWIVAVIGTLGFLFGIYKAISKPEAKADKEIAVINTRLAVLDAAVGKLTTNDIPHIDAKIGDTHDDVSKFRTDVTEKFARLFTIIDERLPRK